MFEVNTTYSDGILLPILFLPGTIDLVVFHPLDERGVAGHHATFHGHVVSLVGCVVGLFSDDGGLLRVLFS